MALVQRKIDLTFQLAKGQFAETSTNSVKVSGLRVSARITNVGGMEKTEINMQVFGLTLSLMNRLSTLGMAIQDGNWNTVTVEAGDDINGMTKVFHGNIVWGYADFTNQPQVPFVIQGFALANEALAPTIPQGFIGQQDVGQLAEKIVGKMNNGQGYPFRNNGVNVSISGPYLWGPLYQQLTQLIQAADCHWNAGADGTISIWPKTGNPNANVAIVSASTGMVGSPSFTQKGIVLRTIFNPAIKIGSQLNVISAVVDVPKGLWEVYYIGYALDAQVPRGEWFQTLQASNPSAGGSPGVGQTPGP